MAKNIPLLSAPRPRRLAKSKLTDSTAIANIGSSRASNSPARILVGTASWSDAGFVADWYPKGLPADERLSWYAEHFNLVEVNSTFYAIPSAAQVERWCA